MKIENPEPLENQFREKKKEVYCALENRAVYVKKTERSKGNN